MPPIARSEAGLYSVSVESFLLDITDVLNSTLDVDTLLTRISDSLRQIIDFDIFAIMLLNEKTQELRMRFHFGHSPEVDKIRVKVGEGVTGKAVELREPILVADVTEFQEYIAAHPSARSELAVPLITKNRVIGVIDIQSRELNYFNEYHKKLLTLVASRIATAIENARLYTRVAKQAQNLSVLNEISRELTSILNLDELLKRIGESLSRVIDYQMFSILLLDESGTVGKSYGAKTTPHMFIIGTDGNLAYMGSLTNKGKTEKFVEPALKSLLAGETIKVTKTASFGCNVKYVN